MANIYAFEGSQAKQYPSQIDVAKVPPETKITLRSAAVHFVTDREEGKWPSSFTEAYVKLLRKLKMDKSFVRIIHPQELDEALDKPEIRNEVSGVFILEQMKGELFDKLIKRSSEEKNCRILSSNALLDCISLYSEEKCKELVPVRTSPLFSLALYGEKIGIASSEAYTAKIKIEIIEKVRAMGGTSGKENDITILVSENVLTRKARHTKKEHPGLPIVTRSFVDKCYEIVTSGQVLSPKQVENYKALYANASIFEGYTFCLYKLSNDHEQSVKKTLTHLGAYFESEIKSNCQYVIYESKNDQNQKTKDKEQHKTRERERSESFILNELISIKQRGDFTFEIITLQWIEKCVKANKMLEIPCLRTDVIPTTRKSNATIPKLGFQVRVSESKRPHPYKSQFTPGSGKVPKIVTEAEKMPNDHELYAMYTQTNPSTRTSNGSTGSKDPNSSSIENDSSHVFNSNDNEASDKLSELPNRKSQVKDSYGFRIVGSQENSALCIKSNILQVRPQYEQLIQACKIDKKGKNKQTHVMAK